MTATKTDELYGIQILRGIAALVVVIHHMLEASNGSVGKFSPNWLTTSGAAGVDIFFVISGFIMMYSSFKSGRAPLTPSTFLLRRFLRIYPFYWACLAAMTLLCLIGFMKGLPITFAIWLKSLLLIPGQPLVNVSWTLSYEIFFYLVFAASLFLASKVATCIATTFAIILAIVIGSTAEIPFFDNPISIEFCFGLLLALLPIIRFRGELTTAVGSIAVVIAAAAPIFTPHADTGGLNGWSRVAAWGVPAFFIVAASLQVSKPIRPLGRMALLLGNSSYAIYLTHAFGMIAYGWLVKYTVVGTIGQMPVVFAAVIICCAVGIFSHLLIERPLVHLVKGRLGTDSLSTTYRKLRDFFVLTFVAR